MTFSFNNSFSFSSPGRAIRADAVDGDLVMFGLEPVRQRDAGPRFRRQVHIKHRIARIAIKMAMLAHVRTEPGGAAVELHLAHEAAFYQGIEAVVNRGHGNVRRPAFNADEDLLGGRVIALFYQHAVNVLALRRGTQAARDQPFGQAVLDFAMAGGLHGGGI